MTTVLHLITRYLDGGSETTTRNTLEALRDAQAEYDLRLGTGHEHDPNRLSELERQGIETVVFRSLRHYNPITSIVAVFAVARYLRRHDVDVLHTHSTEAGVVGRWAGRLAGTPVVIHEIHGDPITKDRNSLLNCLLLTLERRSAPLADRLIVKADRMRDLFLDRGIGSPDQYTLIHHGVRIDRFLSATVMEPSEENCLLFVGQLKEGKGLFDLLEAADRLREDHDFVLRIAGDGPLADQLQRDATKRGLDSQVEFLGYRDDVPTLMADADVFVLPSYREGTPRVITEALAAGLPVVSTRIAGIPEQVRHGDTGYLIPPGETSELVDRIAELLSNPDRRSEMGERARDTVEPFARDTAQRKYISLYRELLSEVDP